VYLKRVYDTSGPAPVLIAVRLLHAGPRQHFSPRFLERAKGEGWLRQDGVELVFSTVPPVTYRIDAEPGYFCCHCNGALPDGATAAAHVGAVHDGLPSPDAGNPAGYRLDAFFACARVA
jgi:hypothetical protein